MSETMTAAGEFRITVHRHLRRYPLLTLFELSRATGINENTLRRLVPKMEADGELACEVTPKTAVTSKAVTRWRAT